MRRTVLMGGVALTVAMLPLGLAAQAREAPPEAPQAAEVGEVVVTARRREEALKDVPASVSVINEQQAQTLVLDRSEDVLRQVPGTALVTSGPDYLNDITIRGQGGGRLGFSETATGIYKDGIYAAGGGYGGRSLNRLDLFDTARIEVLRGPQGALFGRNSVGGAINVITNKPGPDLGGRVTARYSDPGRTDGEAVLNLPIGERFGVRIAGFVSDQDDGFIHLVSTGEAVDTQRMSGVRTSAALQLEGGSRFDLSWEHSDSRALAFTALGQRTTRIDGTVLDPSAFTRADMNRIGVSNILENTVSFTNLTPTPLGDLSVKLSYTARDGDRNNEDGDHFNGTSSIDVAPGAAVLYQDLTDSQTERYRATGFESDLTGVAGPVTWLAGVELIRSTSDVVTDSPFCPAYTGTLQANAAGCIVGVSGTFTPATSAASIASATARALGRLGMNHDGFSEELKSYSAFGSVEVPLGPKLALGVELRVQTDKKTFDMVRYSQDPLVYFGTGAVPAGLMAPITADPDGAGPLTAQPVQFCPPTVAAGLCAAGLETAYVNAEREWTFWTPTATLRWTFANDQKGYARFSTGYRPGGFNTNLAATTVRSQLASSLIYDPEYAYNYELGWKGSLFNGAIQGEAAVFYMWTNNVQAVSAPSATSRGFVLQNAGDAHVQGVEVSLRRSQPLGPGRLQVGLNYASQDGAFEKGAHILFDLNGDNVPDLVDLEGKRVPRLRDYQVTLNLSYSQHLWAGIDGTVSVSGQFADGGFQNPPNTVTYPEYAQVDARMTLSADHWRLSVFGRNLGDRVYVLNNVSSNNYWSQPRVVGVELTWRP